MALPRVWKVDGKIEWICHFGWENEVLFKTIEIKCIEVRLNFSRNTFANDVFF